MNRFEIALFPARSDNFCVLLHDPGSGATAAIDAPDADVIIKAAELRGWRISEILVTHKHHDHIEGIPALKAAYDCKVTGPEKSAAETGMYGRTVKDGDVIDFAGAKFASSPRPATPSTTSPTGCRGRRSSSSATLCSRSAAAASSRARTR